MNKHSRALSRARYLCDSDLRSEVVIPLLMQELNRVVRFGSWGFSWSNAEGQLVNSALSALRPETLQYLAEHFDELPRDLGYSFVEAMLTFPAVFNPRRERRINPRMDETESYRRVWGPEGCYFNLTLVIRTQSETPLGMVQLFRPKDDVDFTIEEEGAIRHVLPYLRRALERAMWRTSDLPLAQEGESGVAVFRDDDPLFISDRAFALSTMAFNSQLPVTADGLQLIDPVGRLRDMYRAVESSTTDRLVATGVGRQGTVRSLSNEWGTFSFEWEPSLQKKTWAWSVVIRHRIPVQLRLLSTPEGLSLSDRQLEVCRRLLDGQPTPRIAEEIGVKRATLKDHTREIYRKFGVKDRDELLRKVMGAAARRAD